MHFLRYSCFVLLKKFPAPLALCCPPSALMGFVRLLCYRVLAFMRWSRPRRGPTIAPVPCSNHIQIDRTEIVSAQPEYFAQVFHPIRAQSRRPFKFSQRGDVVLSGIRRQLPIIRHACPKIAANTCWWAWSLFQICSANFWAHPKRRTLSSVAIGTVPSFRCICLVNARKRLAGLFRHASMWLSSPSVKLPFRPAKAHCSERTAPCTVVLKTLHLNLNFTFAFQNCPITCHAFQAALILIFRRVPSSAAPEVAYFRLRRPCKNPLPRCLRCLRQSHLYGFRPRSAGHDDVLFFLSILRYAHLLHRLVYLFILERRLGQNRQNFICTSDLHLL